MKVIIYDKILDKNKMSEAKNMIYFEKIKVFSKLRIEKELLCKFKLLYVFRYNDIFLVTNEDKVYCCGNNDDGVLGFGHENVIGEFTLNEELSHKQIIDFSNSLYHTIARTRDGKLYCWGCNGLGYLGVGRNDEEIYGPELNSMVDEIIDICCGGFHTLVLTLNEEVFAFGGNRCGQIGSRSNENVLIPFKVDEFGEEKVKAIACGLKHSMALTENGCVYSWGLNDCGQLGQNERKSNNKPKHINIKVKIIKISCGFKHSILLSSDKDIYVFGSNKYKQLGMETKEENQLTPLKLNYSEKFIEIASHYKYNISAALSEKGLYYVWGNCGEEEIINEPKETQFKSFNEIFAHYFQITFKTINKLEEQLKNLFENIENQKYKNNFIEIKNIDSGSFGEVCEVSDINLKTNFAIKKIPYGPQNKKEELIREPMILEKLSSKYVVKCFDFWVETNSTNNSKLKPFVFYIQMELCYKSLKEINEIVKNELKLKVNDGIYALSYYISSEIFKELVECVNYLHTRNPQIIHRDLKPDNILISYGSDGRFVKIADLGYAVIHECNDRSHTKEKGCLKYMAPELNSTHYDTRVDIHSLGVIAIELFNIDDDESFGDLGYNKSVIEKLIKKMTERDASLRPTYSEIINEPWIMDIKELSDVEKLELESKANSIEECFHLYFIKAKLQHSSCDGMTENIVVKNTYFKDFNELEIIDFGNCGIVCKAIDKRDNRKYAIKKVPIYKNWREEALKEIEILAKLKKSELIVNMKSCWIEKNYCYRNKALIKKLGAKHELFKMSKPLLLHIQMDLCYKTLDAIIKILNDELKQEPKVAMSPLGYYISSEIFIEILESVDYLHNKNIIHRDLKLTNILITDGSGGRFIKVSDFGLAKIHKYKAQSHTQMEAIVKYAAPELREKEKYDTKVDVYSLGIICQDLYNTSIRNPIDKKTRLKNKYSKLFGWIENMVQYQMNIRPNCEKILKGKDEWALSLSELKKLTDLKNIIETDSKSIVESFHKFFIRVKNEPSS